MSILLTNDKIISMKKYLKKRITGFEIQLDHIRERLQLLDLIKCTIDVGESNSILLIGPRGSGKTAVIFFVIEDYVKKDYNNQIEQHLTILAYQQCIGGVI